MYYLTKFYRQLFELKLNQKRAPQYFNCDMHRDTDSALFSHFSLKRDKSSFRMSTTALSPQHNKTTHHREYIPEPTNHQIQHNNHHITRQQPKILNNIPHNPPEANQHEKLKTATLFKSMIQQHRQKAKKIQQRTHYYYNRSQNDRNQQQIVYIEEQFPPKLIKQLINIQKQKIGDGNIAYHYGILQKCGYLYFSIERLLVLIRMHEYLQPQNNEQPIIMQLCEHALCVKQGIISEQMIQNKQLHPFGHLNCVIMIWLQWQIQFYSLQIHQLIKLKSLNMKLATSCQACFQFDFSQNGDIYYLSSNGELGRIQLIAAYRDIFKIEHKFGIKEYFFKFRHNTHRKRIKNGQNGLFNTLKQFIQDTKYYFTDKKIQGISLTCDKTRGLVFTMVRTTTRPTNPLDPAQSHSQIRIYNISKQRHKSIWSKVQSDLYSDPPTLIFQLTEQKLYSEIGVHLFNNMTIDKFQFAGFHIPQPGALCENAIKNQTNLIIILTNGSRIYLYLTYQKLTLNQMINLPNLEEVLNPVSFPINHITNRNPNKGMHEISQKQPLNFRLLKYKLGIDGSFCLVGIHKKIVIGLIFGRKLGDYTREYVQIVEERSLQTNQSWKNGGSMFVNLMDYDIFITLGSGLSSCKQKLLKYEKKVNENPDGVNYPHPPFQEKYQILNSQHKLYIRCQDRVKIALKLRPVDIVVQTLQQNVVKGLGIRNGRLNQSNTEEFIQKVSVSLVANQLITLDFDIRLEIFSMLLQIYCDVEGEYCFQQLNFKKQKLPINNLKQQSTTIPRNKKQYQYHQKQGSYRIANNQQGFSSSNLRRLTEMERQQRLTEKLTKMNTLQKFRHSDLNISDSINEVRRLTKSPVKIRSDNSILRLIQGLLGHAFKKQMHEAQDSLNFSKYERPQNNKISSNQTLHRIILTYLTRVLSIIWPIKILQIDNTVLGYIIDMCSKMLELLMTIHQANPDIKLQNVQYFILQLQQYCCMLCKIVVNCRYKFGEGFYMDKGVWEQILFLCLQKNSDISAAVNNWRQQFPKYFNMELFKAIKMQAQINVTQSQKNIKILVINNSLKMPKYLLQWYYHHNIIDKQELLHLTSKQYKSHVLQSTAILNVCKNMDPPAKHAYFINEIRNDQLNIAQKQIIIAKCRNNLGDIRTLTSLQIRIKSIEIQQISDTINLQEMIIKQVQNMHKGVNKQKQKIVLDDNIRWMLNHMLLQVINLQKLVNSLQLPYLKLAYLCVNKKGSDHAINSVLKDMTQFKIQNKLRFEIDSKYLRVKLNQIFIKFPKSSQKLKTSNIQEALNELCCKQLNFNDLTRFLTVSSEELSNKFWVPQFLKQSNFNNQIILDQYLQQINKNSQQNQLKNKPFMYNWLCAYVLVKKSYLQGRRAFQVATEMIASKIQRERGSNDMGKKLVNFLKDNLNK